MKKIFVITTVCSLLLLSGCSSRHIKIYGGLNNETNIEVQSGYKFKDFTKEYNGKECKVTLIFAQEGEENK